MNPRFQAALKQIEDGADLAHYAALAAAKELVQNWEAAMPPNGMSEVIDLVHDVDDTIVALAAFKRIVVRGS